MAIIGLQRRFREVGRIRMGVQVPTRSGKRAPRKLDNFRLTSGDRAVIEAVAAIYGGTVKEWDNDGSPEWEVTVTATELRIALPPSAADLSFSQFYESWAKGYCTRRCDGERDAVRDVPCDCDPDDRTCKATTRLTVLLPDIAGLGTWRLESHGYYAAVELSGAVELIEQLAGVRSIVPARLRLEQREKRRLIDGEAKVFKFAVPVIDLDVSIHQVRQLAQNNYGAIGTVDDLSMPEPQGWKPVPAVEAPLALTVEAQVKEHEQAKPPAKKRANAAAPLPATGRAPRKASEVEDQVCSKCSKPYGADPLRKNPVGGPGQSRFIHVNCTGSSAEPAIVKAVEHDGHTVNIPDTGTTPPPATGPSMSANQHAKMMALAAKTFPVGERRGPEADAWRRRNTLTLCDMLAIPGLTSRAQLSKAQASTLIDALVQIEAGTWSWQVDADEMCYLVEDGEPLGSEPLREDDR